MLSKPKLSKVKLDNLQLETFIKNFVDENVGQPQSVLSDTNNTIPWNHEIGACSME